MVVVGSEYVYGGLRLSRISLKIWVLDRRHSIRLIARIQTVSTHPRTVDGLPLPNRQQTNGVNNMARVTIAMMQDDNTRLRERVIELQDDLEMSRSESRTYRNAHSVLEKHLSTMTIGNERLADALSHSIGFVTDRSRIVEGRSK